MTKTFLNLSKQESLQLDAHSDFTYRILLIIRSKKLWLFHIFIFIPEKRSQLSAFTSFHSIHMQIFTKKLLQLQSNPRKT